MKIDGSLAQNIDFEVANLEVPTKTRRKKSILKLQSVKISRGLARNARFDAPTCLVLSLWFSCCVYYGGSCKTSTFRRFPISKVSKQVVMSFCVAGVALCDIPICLTTCRRCQNWMKSRTKCSFCCAHVSRLESMVFLWRRRVYGGSCQTSPFRRFPRKLSCRFAWQEWHFATFQPV